MMPPHRQRIFNHSIKNYWLFCNKPFSVFFLLQNDILIPKQLLLIKVMDSQKQSGLFWATRYLVLLEHHLVRQIKVKLYCD